MHHRRSGRLLGPCWVRAPIVQCGQHWSPTVQRAAQPALQFGQLGRWRRADRLVTLKVSASSSGSRWAATDRHRNQQDHWRSLTDRGSARALAAVLTCCPWLSHPPPRSINPAIYEPHSGRWICHGRGHRSMPARSACGRPPAAAVLGPAPPADHRACAGRHRRHAARSDGPGHHKRRPPARPARPAVHPRTQPAGPDASMSPAPGRTWSLLVWLVPADQPAADPVGVGRVLLLDRRHC